MNLQEAQLIRDVLDLLTGSLGKSPYEIAKKCGITLRRTNYLLLCLEKAGLVRIQREGRVVLADALAVRAWNHVAGLHNTAGPLSLSVGWSNLHKAIGAYESGKSSLMGAVFNDLFSGAK